MARRVTVSHPEKLLFADDGITKADLVDYYGEIAPVMLRHLRDRPLSLQQFPAGIARKGFFSKQVPKGMPDWVRTVRVPKEDGTVDHIIARDEATLRLLANHNAVAFHEFTSRADELHRPDRIVFDLDPPDGRDFTDVRLAALMLGTVLRQHHGWEPFAMVTGSRGIHVVVALRRGPDHEAVLAFAREVAADIVRRAPGDLTTEFRKAKRGGRIFVDVLRNRWAQTTIAPYSVRPLPGAPVATPLAWEELDDAKLTPDAWSLTTVRKRLAKLGGDPWAGIARRAKALQ